MKPNYRIVFHDGPEGNRSKNVDICADSFEDARKKAWQMPEARNRLYSDMMIEEIPEGPSIIGIEFEWTCPYINGVSTGYLFIKANDETEAVKYYNEHFKGKSFAGADYGKNSPDAYNVRGRIRSTYFAAGMRCDADATIKENDKSLNDKISDAEIQKSVSVKETDARKSRLER